NHHNTRHGRMCGRDADEPKHRWSSDTPRNLACSVSRHEYLLDVYKNGPLAVPLCLLRPGCRGVSNKGLPGLMRAAALVVCGVAALSIPSRFAISSERKYVDPVTFPPGRARLVTRPAQNSNQHSALGA